jgi:hypothetical protein
MLNYQRVTNKTGNRIVVQLYKVCLKMWDIQKEKNIGKTMGNHVMGSKNIVVIWAKPRQ